MNAVNLSSLVHLIRIFALVVFVILALGALLLISPSPAVHSKSRPNSADVHAAREIWHQLKASQNTDIVTRVRVDNRMIKGLAALASDATGRARFDAKVAEGELSAQASLSLPAGLWVNVAVATRGEHSGFPLIHLKVGKVSFPSLISRWFVGAARTILQLNGATIPPLDEMFRRVRIDQNEVTADLALPRKSGVVAGVMAVSGQRLDNQLVSDIYCYLVASQQANPTSDLSEVVRRTFGQPNVEVTEDYSRAAFVALSFLVVGDTAKAMAPQAAEFSSKCARLHAPILLHQRQDLAMHWTLSAALVALLGEQATTSLGEWKELHDSLPRGSGFSFVDIAANRAGLQTARNALNPNRAKKVLGELGQATEEDLLPKVLLNAPEGLSGMQFRDRFGRLDNEMYGRAIISIDQQLARE